MSMNKKKSNSRIGKPGLQLKTDVVPAAKNVRVEQNTPRITMKDGGCRIVGHEQVTTINGSVAFSATQIRFNPGLSEFAWLSLQSVGWEKYKMNQLEFVYVPAEAVTTTPGTVYLAFDYDPTDAPPSTLAGISTYETQASGRVFESLECFGRVDRMHDGVQKKKVRQGPVGGDLMLYDACTINIATISCAGTTAIGQLWVYYDIELYSRQVEPPLRISPSLFVAQNSATTFTTGVTKAIDFDTPIVNGLGITDDGAGTFTIGIGSYLVSGLVRFSDSVAEALTSVVTCSVGGVPLGYSSRAALVLTAGASYTLPFNFYVTTSEQTTLAIEANLTGAAGALTAPAGNGYLQIQAV